MSCLMREGLGNTVSIACMPSVTGYYTITVTLPIIGTVTKSGYADIIICKWQINGVDHYDTEVQADTDCGNIGYNGSPKLFSTGYISKIYRATPTNDQAMITKYIDSSVCGR